MPPKQVKRVRRAAASIAPTAKATKRNSAAVTVPLQILPLITSYFRYVPIEAHTFETYHLAPNLFALERQDVLRAMSQTCSSWRAFARPLLWENVEMAGITQARGKGPWHTQCKNMMLAKCSEIVETPEVARYVRGMRFVVTSHSVGECLDTLAEAMAACPNLAVVNVYFAQNDTARAIKAAFDGKEFPGVEKVILPSQAHWILRCCPNVKEVVNHQGDGSQVVSAIQAKCKKVEVLAGTYPDVSMMKRILKAAPDLREMRFGPGNQFPHDEGVELLGSFKNLRTVYLKCGYDIEKSKIEEYFKPQLDILTTVMHDCRVVMTPYSQGQYFDPMGEPVMRYRRKIYIK